MYNYISGFFQGYRNCFSVTGGQNSHYFHLSQVSGILKSSNYAFSNRFINQIIYLFTFYFLDYTKYKVLHWSKKFISRF